MNPIALGHLLLLVLALPALGAGAYLLAMTLLSAPNPVPPRSSRRMRFDVIVPAHDESAVIMQCLASLERIDWPQDLFRILVIADNCDDATAPLARSAGVRVIERRDPDHKGKGYALKLAFETSRAEGFAEAVVIVDADSIVSPNLLEACASRIERGAHAIQVDYGVLNPGESWRTRLMAIAHGAFHTVRSRARERLGLSCGIRGNGWCLTHAVLDAVPYAAFTLTEDLEYGIALGLSGVRVHYAGEAFANAEMAVVEGVARRQRERWEDGRFDLIRSQALPLLRVAIARRCAICLDLALDLLVLPLSYVVLYMGAFLFIAALAAHVSPELAPWLAPAVAAPACVALYVARGAQLGGRGLSGVLDLLAAPFYVVWKLLLLLHRYDRTEWAPTRRRGP